MRISFGGRYSVPGFRDAFARMVDDLLANGVEEVAGVSVYLRPSANGRPLQFRDAAGGILEHLVIDGSETRVFTPTSLSPSRTPHFNSKSAYLRSVPTMSEPPAPLQEPKVSAHDVGLVMESWGLSQSEAATLIASAPLRVSKLLREPDARLCKRERDRLALLVWIDALLRKLLPPDRPLAEWLRGPATMEGFRGDTPLEQLLSYGLAASRHLCAALCALSRLEAEDGRGCLNLDKGFDAVLN